ncbi:MAG: S-layer homology domain-containing protein, partial [Candidatus Bipolaricaulota bacterium]|nr:S-layer homology domain-containing protein [Candidatus Bipolaricaulota bacterium]
LTEMGVVYGYPDGTFRGDRAVSRREMVLFLYRLWLKAKEVGDKALEELAQKLAKDMAGLASVQAALEDRLAQLEATAKAALRPEDREALLDRQKKAEEALAAMDQRTLAWSEDSVLLQKEVKGLKEETAKALEEVRQAQARLENALRQALSQESAVLRQSLESTFQ